MADAQGSALISVSGGDAPGANPLIPFFGYPLNADQLINSAYNLPHEAIGLSDGQDFADLYKGPSPFMSITLQALIVEADEWPTRVLMPWYHTDKVCRFYKLKSGKDLHDVLGEHRVADLEV